MPSTIVELGLTVAGDAASFDATQKTRLKVQLKQALICLEPTCLLSLRVSAGSINVAAILTIPDATVGGASSSSGTSASAAAAAVSAAAMALVSQPPSAISSILNVPVEATAPVTVGHAIVPVVVAPPPPSPQPVIPPSTPTTPMPRPLEPPPPPVPTPLRSPQPPSLPLDEQVHLDPSPPESSGSSAILAAVGGIIVILLLAAVYTMRQRAAKRQANRDEGKSAEKALPDSHNLPPPPDFGDATKTSQPPLPTSQPLPPPPEDEISTKTSQDLPPPLPKPLETQPVTLEAPAVRADAPPSALERAGVSAQPIREWQSPPPPAAVISTETERTAKSRAPSKQKSDAGAQGIARSHSQMQANVQHARGGAQSAPERVSMRPSVRSARGLAHSTSERSASRPPVGTVGTAINTNAFMENFRTILQSPTILQTPSISARGQSVTAGRLPIGASAVPALWTNAEASKPSKYSDKLRTIHRHGGSISARFASASGRASARPSGRAQIGVQETTTKASVTEAAAADLLNISAPGSMATADESKSSNVEAAPVATTDSQQRSHTAATDADATVNPPAASRMLLSVEAAKAKRRAKGAAHTPSATTCAPHTLTQAEGPQMGPPGEVDEDKHIIDSRRIVWT